MLALPIGDEALQRAYGHRLVLSADDARLFALGLLRAHTTADGGQIRVLFDPLGCRGELALGDEVDEGRDIYADGTSVDALGLLALQASLGFGHGHLCSEPAGDLEEILDAFACRPLGHDLPGRLVLGLAWGVYVGHSSVILT